MRAFAFSVIAAAMMCSGFAQTTTSTGTRTASFAPLGLGSTETAQINVVNTASNSSTGTAASCTGTISFLNATGATIGTATPFTVASGAIFTARLPFASSGGSGVRTVIRPSVSLTISTASPRPPCSLEISIETYETSSGATHVYQSGESVSGGGGRS